MSRPRLVVVEPVTDGTVRVLAVRRLSLADPAHARQLPVWYWPCGNPAPRRSPRPGDVLGLFDDVSTTYAVAPLLVAEEEE